MKARLVVAAGVVLAVAVAATLALRWWDHRDTYPGSLAGAHTNVSADRTLSDHGIRLPDTADGFRYSSAKGDGYPLFAYFTDTCARTETFVSGNGFRPVSRFDTEPELVTFAEGEGWRARDTTRWYGRNAKGPAYGANAMVEETGAGVCRVYLLSDESMNPAS